MRIASLAPSATEIVYALGLGNQLVARSHACDFPAETVEVPVATRPTDPATPGERLDRRLLADVGPDLVLTSADDAEDTLPYEEVHIAVSSLPGDPTLVALSPQSIEGILNSIATVGAFAEAEDEAVGLIEIMREQLGILENRVLERRLQGIASRRVVVLEGLEPPMTAGRWLPEMVRRAGGWELLGQEGGSSQPTTWRRIREIQPEVIVLAPLGMDAATTTAEVERLPLPSWFDEIEAVRDGELFAVDGTGLLSRPGPRVIDGVSLLAALFDPEAFTDTEPSDAWIPLGPRGISVGRG